jgi:DNA-binding transcriptional ArsR family regulator
MPYRSLVTKELAELFGVLSHPLRIQIVEELHGGERDVNSLAEILKISQSGVSQHLSLLRAYRLIVERKQGRNVFYRLRHEHLASWALDGLKFAGPQREDVQEFQSAIEKARALWSDV